MKNIRNLKSLYLKWRWSFSLKFFEKKKSIAWLSPLVQTKSPETVYLTEQGQLMSHRNSKHSVRRRTKILKTSNPWYRNVTVYSVMHLKLKHICDDTEREHRRGQFLFSYVGYIRPFSP